jgi:hypothetical protein
MSEANFIKGVSTTLTDGNIVVNNAVDEGSTILIIGTASRGPVNTPIKINKPEDAIRYFGPMSNNKTTETLVSGFNEVYAGPEGQKDIRLVRISNGSPAVLEVIDNPKDYALSAVSLRLTSLYPGDIYNNITVRKSDNGQTIDIYNPLTDLISSFEFSTSEYATGSVAKNSIELAALISADPNTNSIIAAEPAVYAKRNKFTFIPYGNPDCNLYGPGETANGEDVGVHDDKGYIQINLKAMFANRADITHPENAGYIRNFTDTADPHDTMITNFDGSARIPIAAGKNVIELSALSRYFDAKDVVIPVAGKAEGVLPYAVQSSSTGVTAPFNLNFRQSVTEKNIGLADGVRTNFSFDALEEIDTDQTYYGQTFKVIRLTPSMEKILVPADQFTITDIGGQPDNMAAVDFIVPPSAGEQILITYLSLPYGVQQVNDLKNCKVTDNHKVFFAVGSRIFFGASNPTDVVIEQYPAKKTYMTGTDMQILDVTNSTIVLRDTLGVYNPTTAQYEYETSYTFDFQWSYIADFPDFKTAAQTLSGGKTGSSFTNAEKYRLLNECYAQLSDFPIDILLLPNTYVDDVKIEESLETGLPIQVNAGFLQQANNFLEGLAIGVSDAYGIMDVKPVDPRTGDVKSWVTKLVVPLNTDSSRAANIMVARDFKRMVVTAGNLLATSYDKPQYLANMSTITAGLLAKLPVNESIMSKGFNSSLWLESAYRVSSEDVKRITDAGYTTFKVENNGEIEISKGLTASKIGSDYKLLSSLRIAIEAAKIVRRVSKPYIGQFYDAIKRTSHRTQLQNALFKLQEMGAVKFFNFDISSSPSEEVEGIINIELTLRVYFELTIINLSIRLTNAD